MSLRYTWNSYWNEGEIVTSTSTVIVGPIDVSHLDRFMLMYQNAMTAINFLTLHVQAALDSSQTAAGTPSNWVTVSTNTIHFPSALGATAIDFSTAVNNAFHWIRIVGGASQTAAARSSFRLLLGGFQRS